MQSIDKVITFEPDNSGSPTVIPADILAKVGGNIDLAKQLMNAGQPPVSVNNHVVRDHRMAVGFTRPNKEQSKKARKQAAKSRKINRHR